MSKFQPLQSSELDLRLGASFRMGIEAYTRLKHKEDPTMPLTEKDRKRNRRQRRQKRIHSLKERYAQAKDSKSRDIIAEKIRRYQPLWDPSEQVSE